MAQANEVGELGLAAVLDRDDVISFESVPDAAAWNGADTISARQR
jgi:hypothetical protein